MNAQTEINSNGRKVKVFVEGKKVTVQFDSKFDAERGYGRIKEILAGILRG